MHEKNKPNESSYVQSRRSQLAFHLSPPPPLPLLLSIPGIAERNPSMDRTVCLSYLKDINLQCNINNTNGYTSGIS